MISLPSILDVPLRRDEHGVIHIGSTRVMLELVIYAFRRGQTPESIVQSYTTLSRADVYAVLAYYLNHRAEVDAYVAEAEAEEDRIRREIDARHPENTSFKEHLQARMVEKK